MRAVDAPTHTRLWCTCVGWSLRAILSGVLCVSAVLKAAYCLESAQCGIGGVSESLPYWIAIVVELVLALLLLFSGQPETWALVTACGFLGAGAVTAIALVLGQDGTCHCLGAWQLAQSRALMVQGAIVACAGGVVLLASPESV
jgi:hypothetical protein